MTHDPRIGQLIREGATIYYAYVDGAYVESPNIGSVVKILGNADDAAWVERMQQRPTFRWLNTDVVI